MSRLSASQRAKLPDSAFAYVDAAGRRLLPIHDEAHVKNALARFGQVKFESDAARERARKRLLNAAKKYRLVPVGFITGQFDTERRHAAAGRVVIELGRIGAPAQLEQQLRSALRDPTLAVLHWSEAAGSYLDGTGKPVPLPADEDQKAVTYLGRNGRPMTALVHNPRVLDDPALSDTVMDAVRFVIEKESQDGQARGRRSDVATLPTGFVTVFFSDIEGSTSLLSQLGDRYANLLEDMRSLIRHAVLQAGGREVDARADEFFGVFEPAGAAVKAALAIQRTIGERAWHDGLTVRLRVGIHSGLITLTDNGYIGLSVHTAARVCSAGHGGQIVISREARAAIGESLSGIEFRSLGEHRLAGLPEAEELFQVVADGLLTDFPPLRTGHASATKSRKSSGTGRKSDSV